MAAEGCWLTRPPSPPQTGGCTDLIISVSVLVDFRTYDKVDIERILYAVLRVTGYGVRVFGC